MTRVTNFGRKRTYLEAGFHDQCDPTQAAAGSTSTLALEPEAKNEDSRTMGNTSRRAADESALEPPKKRRKRIPQSKQARPEVTVTELGVGETQECSVARKKIDRKKKAVSASEARRLNRIKQKLSGTTCFACREQGHAAKDCPKATYNGEDNDRPEKSRVTSIGICYRCGSKKHSLSRCKKPNNPDDPFPFASCFVCNGKGHLASGCPQNKGKGIYPNGGCCKLCGETTHLARNCTMRQQANEHAVVIGTAREAGADEDDFHTFKRTTTELDRAEKREEKVKKMLEVKKGVVSGVAVRSDNVPFKKKIVVFK